MSSEVRKILDSLTVDEKLALEQELLARVKAAGRIEEATITAIIERTSGKKLHMTALIDTWQVVEE